jgi:hypothetical protein
VSTRDLKTIHLTNKEKAMKKLLIGLALLTSFSSLANNNCGILVTSEVSDWKNGDENVMKVLIEKGYVPEFEKRPNQLILISYMDTDNAKIIDRFMCRGGNYNGVAAMCTHLNFIRRHYKKTDFDLDFGDGDHILRTCGRDYSSVFNCADASDAIVDAIKKWPDCSDL